MTASLTFTFENFINVNVQGLTLIEIYVFLLLIFILMYLINSIDVRNNN